MEYLPITSIFAALLAVIMFFMTLMVSMGRINLGKTQGDTAKYPIDHGNDENLKRKIAAFSNFTEYAPMCLFMLALIEFNNAPSSLLWILGTAFIAGRLLHVYGMLTNPHFPLPRIIGMLATYATLLMPAGWLFFNT